ncbi:hypothetical protein E5288_WYG001926 [Bos mutus]|uniref:Centrosomal protein POC5 n=1 Tax=Bos mutus TaxID=72004 RepID=A0A6B0RNL2_9CETA|nr:hypothetical protein [Bos mutus]
MPRAVFTSSLQFETVRLLLGKLLDSLLLQRRRGEKIRSVELGFAESLGVFIQNVIRWGDMLTSGFARRLQPRQFCLLRSSALSHECCFHFNANQPDVETVQSSGALDSPVFHSWFWPLLPHHRAPAGAQDLGSDRYTDYARLRNWEAIGKVSEEYEELLRYAIVTPNIEAGVSQPSHSKAEAVPDIKIPAIIDDILQNSGNSPAVRETRMEVGKGCDLNTSSHSKTDAAASPRKPPHPVMDFFSSNLLVDSSSPGSNSSPVDAHEIIVTDFLISDENLQKMENVLDLWSSGLKTNIISELSKWRLNFIDWHRMEMKKEREKHAADVKQLYSQINSLKELQKTYEVSIGRKDEVISSLSHAIGKQKERIELMRTFFHWRINHVKSRQDVYESKLADQYFQRTLLKKVWRGWRAVVQKQWKEVVERACQARAEEVCVQISNDYEAKVALLTGALENAKAEIQRMQHEKEHFEDSMKKAFMRGVCALNLEAMTIFQNRGDTDLESEFDNGEP